MAFSIALTLAQRDNLLSLQQTERFQADTQRHLSSGRVVNDVTDDVFKYFAARSLDDRASEFLEYRDVIDQGISALSATVSTLDSITKLFDQLRGVLQGSAAKTQYQLSRLAKPFGDTLQNIGNLVVDAHYQGVNLIRGGNLGADIDAALTVRFSERHTLALTSSDVFAKTTTTTGTVLQNTDFATNDRFISYAAIGGAAEVKVSNVLRFGNVSTDQVSNLAATSGKASIINPIIENLSTVIRNLNTRAQELGTYIGLLQTRLEFNTAYAVEHSKGTDKYTLADVNQEGAHLVALQTRQQLSLNALAVSGRQQNAVLTLFT